MNSRPMHRALLSGLVVVVMVCALAPFAAQAQIEVSGIRPLAQNVVLPQSRAFDIARRGTVQIMRVDVEVAVREQVATTTMEISLNNPTRRRLQAELIVPVPGGAVVRGFSFQGSAAEPTAQILPKHEARRIYDQIVGKLKDPALLEFVGYNLIRSSVFPVEPRSGQKVRLVYENLLTADGDRVDYILPRTESIDYTIPWHIKVDIKSKRPISTVYSPTHALETTRQSPQHLSVQVAKTAVAEPGPFRLSYLLQNSGVTASLMAYPDPTVGGGYFLLLAGGPAKVDQKGDVPAIKREVTIVLDRSGSMNGQKLVQVKEAARQVIAGLAEGEMFNVIVYNEGVDRFADKPIIKNAQNESAVRNYLKSVTARGGTNIHDALLEALRPKPAEGALPIVLFLTDGLPTMGQTSEKAIREMADKANRFHRRIFTFGVGVDVNTPLLERIAYQSRATTTFVLPGEDVEVKVAGVFRRLRGPVLAGPKLAVVDGQGYEQHGRVRDMIPTQLPDLFAGDQIVLLGQYLGDAPLTFQVSGNYLGEQRTFQFQFSLDKATTANAYVPRLWASRKIGLLVDAIREMGADVDNTVAPTQIDPSNNPRIKELVDEIVRLSIEFGILTEYTAFLAREGTNLAHQAQVRRTALSNFDRRAVRSRSGIASVNQDINNRIQKEQRVLNSSNSLYDAKMKRVSFTTVQQINDRAFYRKGGRWIDSRLLDKPDQAKAARVVAVGSRAFNELVQKLARQNRQGCVSLRGEILLEVDGETVLVY